MEIANRVVKTIPWAWRDFRFLQTDKLKVFPPELRLKLRESILANNFSQPFIVWEHKKEVYCLDGFHRCIILQELQLEGHVIPAELPSTFIECKSRADAARLVLVYSSSYASILRESMTEFVVENQLNVDDVANQINVLFAEQNKEKREKYEEQVEAQGEMPLVPRFSEHYDYVIVFCTNDIEWMALQTRLELKSVKSYKNTGVGLGRVVSFQDFDTLWQKRQTK